MEKKLRTSHLAKFATYLPLDSVFYLLHHVIRGDDPENGAKGQQLD